MTDGDHRYVTRISLDPARLGAGSPPVPADAGLSLLLSTLELSPPVTQAVDAPSLGGHEPAGARFDTFATLDAATRFASAHGGEAYERVLAVQGRWSAWNGYAVSALWEVADPEHEEAFRRSRRMVFEARQENLRTFAFDWLLRQFRPPGDAARYLVLGVYGDETDLRQARSHPHVQRVVAAHPPASLGAVDLTGVRYFRVAAGGHH